METKIPLSDFCYKGFKSQKEYRKIQIIHAAFLQTEKLVQKTNEPEVRRVSQRETLAK